MGTHDFKLKKVPLFARKPVNINVLIYSSHMFISVPSIILIERASDGSP